MATTAPANPSKSMPEADMATKSIDQGWQPPPIKWKCREWASSRYVWRRMAAALLARVHRESRTSAL